MTGLRRVLAGGAGFTVAVVAAIGLEFRLAGIWPRLPEPDFDLDGPIGGNGAADGRPPLRVVWLGDSTVAGEGASDAAHTLVHQVAAGLRRPVDVRILAESGVTAGGSIERADEVAGLRPDLVFVSVGANDASHLHTRGRFGRSYRQLVQALPDGVPLVLLGLPDMGAAVPRRVQPLRAFAEWRGIRLDAEVRRAAGEVGATYVNLAGRTGWLFRRHRDRLYAADRYHPGDAGYEVWARAVLDRMREMGLHEGEATPPPAEAAPA